MSSPGLARVSRSVAAPRCSVCGAFASADSNSKTASYDCVLGANVFCPASGRAHNARSAATKNSEVSLRRKRAKEAKNWNIETGNCQGF